MKIFKFLVSAFMLSFVLILSGCSSTIEVASRWMGHENPADSSLGASGWAMTAIKDEPVLVGFRNDDSCLYVCLMAQDRQTARGIVLSGMTLWFDPEGGKDEHIGIHYPMGMHEAFMPGGWDRPDSNNREGQFAEHRDELLKTSLANVEILGPGKNEREISPVMQLRGMAINIQDEDQGLIYKLKIPMKKDNDHPYAIDLTKEGTIGLQIKTGSAPINRSRGEMGEGESGRGGGRGGYPGRGGGGSGGERSGRGRSPRTGEGQRPEAAKPLDISIAVTLAKPIVEQLSR
ncbi:MAG: hypothetical protein ABSB78_09870 [Bacteroidota bacterium]